MDSIRKVAGRALFILVFFGALVVLYIYAEDIRHKQLEIMVRDFVYGITKDGKVTKEEYEMFLDSVAILDFGAEVELSHISYAQTPYYERRDAAETGLYFAGRNMLSEKKLPIKLVNYPTQDNVNYRLQDKTNEDVLASASENGYVPLPEEGVTDDAVYMAVCAFQKVYFGEKLCTVVKVSERGVSYYMEADDATVGFIGTGTYELTINGIGTGAYVDIVSYPRTQTCVNGHETLLSPSSIALYEATGVYEPCEFCALEPEFIIASASSVSADIGTAWKDLPLSLTVIYRDGHEESISLEDKRLFTSYDSSYCGTQTVRLSFFDYEAEVFNCTLLGGSCDICGAVCENRNFADYERFSYCNGCMDNMPFFYGMTYVQAEYIANNDIVEELLNQHTYYFNRGDYVKVKLSHNYEDISVPLFVFGNFSPIIEGDTIRTYGRN